MSLPYDWRPLGANHYRATTSLKPGELVAFGHSVWRVIEVHPKPVDEKYPWRVRLRPAHINTGDVRDRDHDKAYKVQESTWFDVYPNEHYPICATCLEPLPCREQMAEKVAVAETESLDRYSTAGVCPSCSEPVTHRQESITWQENVVNPIGPPVTFHLRRKCWSEALGYEKRWWKEDPRRPRALHCSGHLTRHHGGSYECTDGMNCPGPRAWHPSESNHYPKYSDCHCVDGAQPPAEAPEQSTSPFSDDDLRLFDEGGS